MHRITGIISLMLLAACVPVHSEEMPQEAIELAELRAFGDEAFARHDADGDGMITREEFEAGDRLPPGRALRFVIDDELEAGAGVEDLEPGTRHQQRFVFAYGGDGAAPPAPPLPPAPDEETSREMFEAADTDGDGTLSFEEYRAAGPAPFHGRMAFDVELDPSGIIDDVFAGFDANEDGVITRDEWPSPERHLARLDTDGDGIISREELIPGGHRLMIHRGPPPAHARP